MEAVSLHMVADKGSYRVYSMHVDTETAWELDAIGIIPGERVDVLSNDHKGTVALRVNGQITILGRHCTFKIKVIPFSRSSSDSKPKKSKRES